MIENSRKEVYFETWCPKCKYEEIEETDDPCNDCLDQPWNINSHKPIYFKEKENGEKQGRNNKGKN